MQRTIRTNSDPVFSLTDDGWLPPPPAHKPLRQPLQKQKEQTFDGFLILPENRSAVGAVRYLMRSLIAGKSPQQCPLVLHGPPGTGKTSLTTTALSAIARCSNGATARAISARELTGVDENDVTRHDLEACDLLIVEDLQHLPARAVAAACHLIDYRLTRQKSLVLSATVGPAALGHLPRRLTSRLAAGLVVALRPPGLQSRRAIVAAAAKAAHPRLTREALEWLLSQSEGVRAALGLLQNLLQRASAAKGPIDRTTAETLLATPDAPVLSRNDPQRIIKRVAAAFSLSEKELLGPSRLPQVLLARQAAMYLTRTVTTLSLPQIARAFANRDHTTVLHACRKIEAARTRDVTVAAMIRQLVQELS